MIARSKLFIVMACVLSMSVVFAGCEQSRVSAADSGTVVHGNGNVVGAVEAPVVPVRGRRNSHGHSPTRRGWLDPRARRASHPVSYRDLWHEQFKYAFGVHAAVQRAGSAELLDGVLVSCEKALARLILLEQSKGMVAFYQKCFAAFNDAKTIEIFKGKRDYLLGYYQQVIDNTQGATDIRSRAIFAAAFADLHVPAGAPS